MIVVAAFKATCGINPPGFVAQETNALEKPSTFPA
jgi:hypothetical protein